MPNSARLVGGDYTYLQAREATFGTPITASGTQIPTEEMTIDHQLKAHQINRATGLRGAIVDDMWVDTVGSTPTAQAKYVLSRGMMPLLPATLQRTPDWAAVANVMTYSTSLYSGLPNFASNEGYFYTLMANCPQASMDERIVSAISNSFTISISPDDNEGALTVTQDFIGQSSATSLSLTPSTITVPTMSQIYSWSDIQSVAFGAVDLTQEFLSAEITVSNNAMAIPTAPAKDYALVRWEVTGSMVLMGDTTDVRGILSAMFDQAPGTASNLVIKFGTTGASPSGSDDLIITVYAQMTGYSWDRSENEKVTVNFTGAFSATGTSVPFSISYFVA